MHPFIKFRNNLLRNGLEYFGLYYGLYEGLVSNNADPENRGRIKIICPAVYGDVEFGKWALPFGMFTGKGIGMYAIPTKESPIWVSFKGGNPEFPLWTYGWYPQEYAPKGVEPGKFLLITPAGYKLMLDEVEGLITLYFDDNRELSMSKDETILKSGNNTIVLKEKISINFGSVNMKDHIEELTNLIKGGIMTGGAGPYVWSPDVIAQFELNLVELSKMME